MEAPGFCASVSDWAGPAGQSRSGRFRESPFESLRAGPSLLIPGPYASMGTISVTGPHTRPMRLRLVLFVFEGDHSGVSHVVSPPGAAGLLFLFQENFGAASPNPSKPKQALFWYTWESSASFSHYLKF